ncbi:hypothetical protein ER308_15990 [Egibacter rhizosphaerae]|uniref:Uncharacterized protein n=1 Tax=Egibacter rhizosphaerae TaxID=1670831 RepID=A0A411YI36_9ACTN|nr:hypothetical protein [Egibacter rhizosphaerae]QBI20928.1 hypothetical protein ER308_15990 [Egibacter rhizosphaerae]
MQWEHVEELLLGEADADLQEAGEVGPAVAAFTGEEPLLLAFLRPFERGAHLDAVVEVAALAVPLGANRIALSIGARAWSLDDPMPPVVPGVGDLRQRAVTVYRVDASRDETHQRSVLWPVEVGPGSVSWGEPFVEEGPPGQSVVGDLPNALVALAEGSVSASPEDVRAQAARCATLGHDLYLAPEGERRLGLVVDDEAADPGATLN